MDAESDDELTWQDIVDEGSELRRVLSLMDPESFPLGLPYPAATEERLVSVEEQVGLSFDAQHRDFLKTADGWPGFLTGDINLLSSQDYLTGRAAEGYKENCALSRAYDILHHYVSTRSLPDDFPAISDLMPIAVNTTSRTVHVIWTTGPITDHGLPVMILTEESPLPEQWPNFYRWCFAFCIYLYMTYLRYELERKRELQKDLYQHGLSDI